jgi:hypothetical protein
MLDPNLAEAHTNLGQLLLEQYQRQEALIHCREAVRLRPNFPEARNNLGKRRTDVRRRYLRLRPGWNLLNHVGLDGGFDIGITLEESRESTHTLDSFEASLSERIRLSSDVAMADTLVTVFSSTRACSGRSSVVPNRG